MPAPTLIDDPELLGACRASGVEFGVPASVHAADFIFAMLLRDAGMPPAEAARHYFASGRESADRIARLVAPLGLRPGPRILDFASGYGCVTRHLANVFPGASVTAADVQDDMLEFLANELGVGALASNVLPEALSASGQYDLVFALSFFSHIPEGTFGRWLAALSAMVAPGGALLFTAHGRLSREIVGLGEIDGDFHYAATGEHPTLSANEYGRTLSLFPFVYARVRELPGMHLRHYEEAAWWGNQDAYVLSCLSD